MSSHTSTARETDMRQLIAEWAYQMWEHQGKPHGCDVVHWLQAEQEIMSSMERSEALRKAARAGTSGPTAKAGSAASLNS